MLIDKEKIIAFHRCIKRNNYHSYRRINNGDWNLAFASVSFEDPKGRRRVHLNICQFDISS